MQVGLISKVIVWFFVCSFIGWVYETIYCTIDSKLWQNRGFLYGPICPIYGIGALAIIFVWHLSGETLSWWQTFLISFLGSMPLEYFTSWLLERLFHARWWDYSDWKFNINGRVCLPAALGFGVAGVFIIHLVYPLLQAITNAMPGWLVELIALVFVALVAADATLTAVSLSEIAQVAANIDESVNRHMEQFLESAAAAGSNASQAISEERARFARAAREQYAQRLAEPARSALQRVASIPETALELPQHVREHMRAIIDLVRR